MTTAPQDGSVQSNWWQRNWGWATPAGCLGCGCLTIVIGTVFGATGFVSIVMGLVKSTGSYQTYQLAAGRVEHDPAVTAALGEPVSAGWLSKSLEQNRQACLRFAVSGANTSGTAYAEAAWQSGAWNLHQLVVNVNGQPQPIVLVAPPANASAPLCPDFDVEENLGSPS